MNELITSASYDITKAELEIAATVAYKRPRNVPDAIKKSEALVVMNEEIAQSCFYVLARKEKDGTKKEIIGPSIRLAEIMASQWTNLRVGAQIVSNDGKFITVNGVVLDLESNNTFLAPVQLAIHGKNKEGQTYTYSENMQQTVTQAAVAKAIRNGIFKAIPLAFVLPVMHIAIKASIGEQKTLGAVRQEVFEKLVKMGIDKQKIFDYYGKQQLNEFSPDDVRTLIGVSTAIKEGHMKIDDAFSVIDEKPAETSATRAKEKLKNLNDKKPTNINTVTGEVTAPVVTFDELKQQLQTATSEDALHLAADMVRTLGEPILEAELLNIYQARLATLKK